MAQAFLGANPGTTVKDVLEPELLGDGAGGPATVDNTTVTGDWVEVNFPACVAIVAEVGDTEGGTESLDIEVQGADDDQGTNLVSYGHFSEIADGDADTERVLVADVYKRYMRAVAIESGDAAVDVRVAVRPKDYWQGNTRTA